MIIFIIIWSYPLAGKTAGQINLLRCNIALTHFQSHRHSAKFPCLIDQGCCQACSQAVFTFFSSNRDSGYLRFPCHQPKPGITKNTPSIF